MKSSLNATSSKSSLAGAALPAHSAMAQRLSADTFMLVWFFGSAVLFAGSAAICAAVFRDAYGRTPSSLAMYLSGCAAAFAISAGVAGATGLWDVAGLAAILAVLSAGAVALLP